MKSFPDILTILLPGIIVLCFFLFLMNPALHDDRYHRDTRNQIKNMCHRYFFIQKGCRRGHCNDDKRIDRIADCIALLLHPVRDQIWIPCIICKTVKHRNRSYRKNKYQIQQIVERMNTDIESHHRIQHRCQDIESDNPFFLSAFINQRCC